MKVISKGHSQVRLLPTGILIVLVFAFLLNACDTPLTGWEYTFINQTQYTIRISISEKYRLSKDSNAVEESGDFYLYSRSSKTLYGVDSGSVDFQWTASSESDNRYIYSVISGSEVTFKERNNEEN